MTQIALVTFDLEDASSSDYEKVTEDLETIGLLREVTDDDGSKSELPRNTYSGEYKDDLSSVALRNNISDSVRKILQGQGLKGKIFVLVAPSEWAWRWRTVK